MEDAVRAIYPFPGPESVFVSDQADLIEYLQPLSRIDLNVVNRARSECLTMLETMEPIVSIIKLATQYEVRCVLRSVFNQRQQLTLISVNIRWLRTEDQEMDITSLIAHVRYTRPFFSR